MTIANIKMKLNPNYDPTKKADLAHAESKIKELLESEKRTILEIGRWLKHVKENDLTHGKWLHWLSSMGFAHRTAQNYMQIYTRFANTSAAAHLSTGALLELKQLPDDVDCGVFLTKKHEIAPNKYKSVAEMTTNEVRKVVKDERVRAGLIKPSPNRRPSITTGATPHINKLINGLSNLIKPIANLLEQGVIDIDSAVEIGNEFSEDVQTLVNSVLNKYEFRTEWVINAVRIGVTLEIFDAINQIQEDSEQLELTYGTSPRVRVGLSLIERDFLRIYNATTVSEITSIMGSIRDQIHTLREQAEQDERAKEQHSWSDVFSFTKYMEAFRIMGLRYGASESEVRQKWRELSKIYHPDKRETGDAEKFKEINGAHEIIREYHRSHAS